MNEIAIPVAKTAADPSNNYVLLRADTLRLLVPQHRVGSVIYLDSRPVTGEQPGWFELAGKDGIQRSVIALSSQIRPLTEFPADRIMVVTLADTDDELFWAWSEVRVLLGVDIERLRLPPVMCASTTPVDEFAQIGNDIAFICQPERLCSYALT